MQKILLLFFIFPLFVFANHTITVQLNWKAQFEFAGFYMAKEMGYYKEVGLDVKIIPLDISNPVDITQQVLQKKADIGVHYSSIIARAINKNDIMLLSYLFQTSPLVGLSKDSLENVTPKHCFYISKNEQHSSIDLLVKKLGVQCIKKHDLKQFAQDPKGIVSAYISNEPYFLPGNYIIEPRKYGYDFYDDIIFTSKPYYQTHKKEVRNFVLATLKGWRYALSHIPTTVSILADKYVLDKTELQLELEARGFLRHCIFSLDKVGIFNIEKLRKMISIYQENGLIKKRKPFYQFVDPLFMDSLDFSFQERSIIANTSLTYSETNWPPFSIPNGKKLEGTIPDYLDIISQRSGLEFIFKPYESWSDVLEGVKKKELDMAMATGETPQKRKYAVFSKPYGVYSFAVATKRENIITDISELDGKLIAVGDGYTVTEILKYYDFIKLRIVPNTQEALKLLHKGEVDGVADILPTLSYYIATGNYKDIVIAQTLREKFALKAMFRKDLAFIVPIFNKALESITQEQKRLIAQKYSNKIVYAVNRKKEHILTLSVLILLLLVMVFAYLAYALKRELKRREQVEQKLQDLVNVDPLTGLYNRRYFHQLLLSDLKQLKRQGGLVMFAIYDIDNFKMYNDFYGHLKGDDVLKIVSTRVQQLCKRENDYLFRLGGEEFGIYTRVENVENIEEFLDSIVKEVARLQIPHQHNKPYGIVTISLGAVVMEVEKGEYLSIEKIYALADDLMYQAKANGKNCAVVKVIQKNESK